MGQLRRGKIPAVGIAELRKPGSDAGQAAVQRRGGDLEHPTRRCVRRSEARRLEVDWPTVWTAINPLLRELVDGPAWLTSVDTATGTGIHTARYDSADPDRDHRTAP